MCVDSSSTISAMEYSYHGLLSHTLFHVVSQMCFPTPFSLYISTYTCLVYTHKYTLSYVCVYILHVLYNEKPVKQVYIKTFHQDVRMNGHGKNNRSKV